MDIKQRLVTLMEQKRQLSEQDKELINNEINKIKNSKINKNTVLIIESHKRHGEVYPSVIKYFLDLGFEVHLYNLIEHQKNNSLIKCHFNESKFKQFSFPRMPESEDFFEIFLAYKIIFVNTLMTHDGYHFILNLEEKFISKFSKDNVYCIIHDTSAIKENTAEMRFLNKRKAFSLRPNVSYNGKLLPFISPIFLGNDFNLKRKKNNICTFIVIGGGNKPQLRNYNDLFSSINYLIDNNLEFKIKFIGVSFDRIEKHFDNKFSNYIELLGELPFDKMYKEILNSDYILFNIDETCTEYEKYLMGGISGSYSLSISFNIPAIIEKKLAINYNLADKSLTYDKNNLNKIMKNAILLSNFNYQKMQLNLNSLKKNLERESINNLREIFNDYTL